MKNSTICRHGILAEIVFARLDEFAPLLVNR